MREIEFRAWHKKYKYMARVADINFNKERINLNAADIGSYKDIELMQYTGLKDKNGVKTFEGDIVKDDRERIFVIEYKFGGFNIVPIDCYNDEFSWNPLGDMQTAGWLNESAEIIGNIWEHKELLNE